MTDKEQVTQADLDDAVLVTQMARFIVKGHGKDPAAELQAMVAEHRIASTAKLEAERDALREAISRMRSNVIRANECGGFRLGAIGARCLKDAISTADTLLPNQTPTPSKESE